MPRETKTAEIERLRLEIDQLLESRRTAEERGERYADLYDRAPLPSLAIDGAGTIRDANLIATEMLARDKHGLLGRRLHSLVLEADQGILSEHVRQCATSANPISCELRLRDATPVRLWSSRIRPALRLYPTIIVDLRERDNAVAEASRLFEAEKTARAASEAKDQFIAILSHELRTPLTPVLAAVTALNARSDVPDHLRAMCEMISRNIRTEARLIDDLLDVTRITQRKMRIERQPTDVHETAREAIETLEPEMKAKRLSIGVWLDAEDHNAAADPLRLKQVFWNLLRNAIKFTPNGGRVEVRSWNSGSNGIRWLRVEVSDNGLGFDPMAAPKLFEPFEQAGTPERHGGLGLGLAICRGVMELHGGYVTATSRGPGTGARFVVEIETTNEMPVRAEIEPSAPAKVIDPKPRILLVEDDRDTGEMMEELLQEAGYEVRTVGSAKAALESDLDTVDLVISDIGLPGTSGLDLMRSIRQTRLVKGVALSGYGTEADIRASREAGFSAHLTKPVVFDQLLATIQQVSA